MNILEYGDLLAHYDLCPSGMEMRITLRTPRSIKRKRLEWGSYQLGNTEDWKPPLRARKRQGAFYQREMALLSTSMLDFLCSITSVWLAKVALGNRDTIPQLLVQMSRLETSRPTPTQSSTHLPIVWSFSTSHFFPFLMMSSSSVAFVSQLDRS